MRASSRVLNTSVALDAMAAASLAPLSSLSMYCTHASALIRVTTRTRRAANSLAARDAGCCCFCHGDQSLYHVLHDE